MKLLNEIIDGASGEDMPISTLLRKCLVLASRLGSEPAQDWVNWELEGYEKGVSVPDYRRIGMSIVVNMHSIAARAQGWHVPPELLDENGKKFTSHAYRPGVGRIEELLSDPEKRPAFMVENLLVYLQSLEITNMEITSAWCECDRGALKNVVDTVRTRVLKLALELSKEIPDAGETENSEASVTQNANTIFQTVVYGAGNVVGHIDQSNLQISVQTGNFESLRSHLADHGVDAADIDELRAATDAEPDATDGKFGPKVTNWIGKMVGKAADGSWSIGIGAAGSLLAEALKRFYGL